MSDLNQYSCTGRLGADPETRTFASGDPVVNLRVAISETWKDRNTGEKKEKTLWMPVKVTNKGICSVAEQYLRKGAMVALSGKLESRSWEADGQTKYVTELVLGPFNSTLTMLGGKSDNAGSPSPQQRPPAQAPSFDSGAPNDDIPFIVDRRL